MKYFRISEDTLKELIRESKFLDALESYGLDNWDGYDMVEDEEYEVSEEDYEEYGAILETEIDDKQHSNSWSKEVS